MIIVFDMDGTIADLYSVENWLENLRAENPAPYKEAKPMWDMEKLNNVLNALRAQGHCIDVISWLSKDSTQEYKAAVRKAKKEWLAQYMPQVDYMHFVQYGTPKASVIKKYAKDTEAILIDDELKNRNLWTLGRTINPETCDLIKTLEKLLTK